jgi:hypothetical protein
VIAVPHRTGGQASYPEFGGDQLAVSVNADGPQQKRLSPDRTVILPSGKK